MQPLRCNHPDIRGYFAHLYHDGTISIREHIDGTDTLFFSQSQRFSSEPRVWVYMPMAVGEHLVAVYVRSDNWATRTRIFAVRPSLIVSKYCMFK
jgi:hypothetical protein